MAKFPEWDEQDARRLISRFAEHAGGLLPALHAVQERFGYVPRQVVALLAEAFNLSRADVHGTISFYHDFRDTPPGCVVRFCRAESCQACGGQEVATALSERLGIPMGGTSEDGRVTLEPAFCLGLCAVSPAALVDGVPLGRVTAESILSALGLAA